MSRVEPVGGTRFLFSSEHGYRDCNYKKGTLPFSGSALFMMQLFNNVHCIIPSGKYTFALCFLDPAWEFTQ